MFPSVPVGGGKSEKLDEIKWHAAFHFISHIIGSNVMYRLNFCIKFTIYFVFSDFAWFRGTKIDTFRRQKSFT